MLFEKKGFLDLFIKTIKLQLYTVIYYILQKKQSTLKFIAYNLQ